jgi:predicted PurR-regulated permease PerM
VANDAGAPRPASRTTSVRAGLTFGSASLLVAAVVVAYGLAGAFEAAHRTIGWVLACSIVALLIDPVVDVVGRVMPRWIAVILVLIVLLAVVASVIAGLYHDVVDSLDELRETAPTAARELEQKYDWLAEIDVAERVEDFVDDLDERTRRDAVTGAVGTVPTYVVTGILMLFILAYGRRYFDGFVDQFSGARRERITRIATTAAVRGRRYLLVVLLQWRSASRAGPRRCGSPESCWCCRRSRCWSCDRTSTPAPCAWGRRCRSSSACSASSCTAWEARCTASPSP